MPCIWLVQVTSLTNLSFTSGRTVPGPQSYNRYMDQAAMRENTPTLNRTRTQMFSRVASVFTDSVLVSKRQVQHSIGPNGLKTPTKYTHVKATPEAAPRSCRRAPLARWYVGRGSAHRSKRQYCWMRRKGRDTVQLSRPSAYRLHSIKAINSMHSNRLVSAFPPSHHGM
jgi:hypothetical protein